jgi:hypothetical protein
MLRSMSETGIEKWAMPFSLTIPCPLPSIAGYPVFLPQLTHMAVHLLAIVHHAVHKLRRCIR